MGRTSNRIVMILVAAVLLGGHVAASELVDGSVESDIVPGPVEYFALLPDGYDAEAEPYPLVLNLHGGRGNRNGLKRQVPMFDELWDNRVRHEYHLVRGAGHVGPSMRDRITEAFQFLARSMNPYKPAGASRGANPVMDTIERLKDRLEEKDHYSQTDAEPTITKSW